MLTIADLSAQQLAKRALTRLLSKGITNEGFRLVYRALILDENQPNGLAALGAHLNKDGFEPLSGGVLEYACSIDCPISAEEKAEIDDVRFKVKWSWGFSHRKDGQKWLGTGDFGDRSDFVVDEQRYQKWLKPLIEEAGSLKNIVMGAHTLIGITGNVLSYKEGEKQNDINDIFYPEKFVTTPFYDQWLATSLDKIED